MKKYNLIVNAHNLRSYGGIIVAKNFINNNDDVDNLFIVDFSLKDHISSNIKAKIIFIKNSSILMKIFIDLYLFFISNNAQKILILNSLPPVLRMKCNVELYLQNALYIYDLKFIFLISSINFFIRILMRRLYFYILLCNVDLFKVQTLSMKNQLELILNKRLINIANIDLDNFSHQLPAYSLINLKRYDFIYVADSMPHKNHLKLINSMILLSHKNLFPSLCLTLPFDDPLWDYIRDKSFKYNLNIINIGTFNHDNVSMILSSSKALIYPSFIESLGLPLLEANLIGIDILAPNYDYVYDVCSPTITFNPYSEKSIEKAIIKYLYY